MTRTDRSLLAGWLLDRTRPAPPPAVLREAGLGAYAYTALPPDAPGKAELRGDYLASLTRHEQIRRELAPLLAAWREAGIAALLFKGFHLAEFVYPVPGARFHGDVDVLVRPEDAERAGRIARAIGWREEANTAEVGLAYNHAVCLLYGPTGAACVDLHRWVLHRPAPWNPVQRRVTEAVWSRSRQREWEGVPVREMDAVDALLVGLVLQRCWGGDHWHLKPHDVLDFGILCERLGIGREQLWERARELGAVRTLRIFLERCDPAAGILELAPPPAAALRRWDRAVFPERGPLGRGEDAVKLLGWAPWMAVHMPAALSAVREARSALRRGPDVHELLRTLTPSGSPRTAGSMKRRWRTVRSIQWTVRLLPGGNPRGDCLVRSLAIYVALRRQGWPVAFVSGVRRDAGEVVGHAWVELDGQVLYELAEPHNRRLYAVNLDTGQP